METVLLIIKSGESYVRIENEDCRLVGLDKASVFPENKLDSLKEQIKEMARLGFEDLRIKKLNIREEEL